MDREENQARYLFPLNINKYKQVKSIPAIDYSKPENIEVKDMPTGINNFKEIMSDGLVQQTNYAWPATGTWHVGQS